MDEQQDRKRVFITGGAGFIGANLVKYLLDRKTFDITVYDNLSACSKANLDKAAADSVRNSRVKFIQGDILDFDALADAIAAHDAAVHLAAHTRVRESIQRPQEHLAINSTGTLNVLEAVRRQRVDKFVFASSNAAVGEQIPPINESMIAKPISPYGAVKLYGEALCSAYYHSYGVKTVALRFANAYGPYSDHKTSVVAKFLKRVREGKTLEIYGDGEQTRDFIHAADICQAIYLAITHNDSDMTPWGEVFQIATGVETRIIDLARMIVSLMGSNEQGITFGRQIKGEIKRNYSAINKANKQLGFAPEVKFIDGIKRMGIN